MSTIDLNEEDVHQVIEENSIVLIDFWADWCGPCKSFAPMFEQSSEKHPDLVFAKVDTEAQQAIAAGFQIRSIPTLMIFKDQIVVFSQAGALPGAALEKLIGGVRELDMDKVRASIEEQKSKRGDASDITEEPSEEPPKET